MKVKYIFAKRYVDVVPVLKKTIPYIKGSVGIITTIQYLHLMKEIKDFFDKHDIPCEALGQVLGCNIKVTEKSKAETILFFGDGLFHPKGMALKEKKYVIMADPVSNTVRQLTKKEIETFENRRYAGLAKFYASKNIGVLVTLKPGQEQVHAALELKDRFPDKNMYILVYDDLNWNSLEDFPFIECFVNTMCPRIAYDDYDKIPKSVVDFNDLMENEKEAKKKK
jgi:2-(3-amino-3-carboxypropyl)histidine synthase